MAEDELREDGEDYGNYNLCDPVRWAEIAPRRGDVVEAMLPIAAGRSVEAVVAFLVLSYTVVEDGSLALLVRCLGSSNVDLYRTMGSRFNRRKGHLHLCQEADCQSFAEGEVHLTSLVLRPGSNYSAGFLTAHGKRLLRDVATAEAEAGEEAEQDGPSAPEEGTLGERERFLKAGKRVGGAGEGVRGGETPPVPPPPGRKRGVSQGGSGKGHAARLSHISSAQQDSKKTLEKDAVRNLKERLSVLKKRAQEGRRASGEEPPRRVTFLDPTWKSSLGIGWGWPAT